MDENKFRELLQKYTTGQCTEHEKALLESWYLTLAKDQDPPSAENTSQAQKTLWDAVRPSTITKRFHYRYLSTAATILLVAAISYYFLSSRQYTPVIAENVNTSARAAATDVMPGGNRATLTLSDGSTINLNAAQMGKLAEQGGTAINKTGQGQLAYGNAANGTHAKPLINTITTPKGGQFQLVLPDGTKVWLNAASSLKFPTVFSGESREVELTGEAYFEVAPNKSRPFLVSSRGTVIEVLGTHFNVMAYDDEIFTATLLEGSVKVKHGMAERVIIPGQEARVENLIKVGNADGENAIAWKNGLTVFNNSSIESIMRQISRWYDLDITYNGAITQRLFTGKIPRSAPLSQVLKILELSDIHFKIEKKQLIITP